MRNKIQLKTVYWLIAAFVVNAIIFWIIALMSVSLVASAAVSAATGV